MTFLQGIHGAVALVLLCGLLFAEEAGVPLPFAPGEVVLLGAGLLIAAGGLDPFLFLPLSVISCIGGAIVGYGWASLVGPRGLQAVAAKVHGQKALARVSLRLNAAGPRAIAISRLIPGLRIYTTLIAGALRVPRRTFLIGMVPTTAIWVVFFVALGALVGLPVEHFFNQVERIAVQGAILAILGGGVFFAIRRTPPSSASGLIRVPRWLRIVVAIAVDIGIVSSLVTGLLALGRGAFGIGLGGSWVEAVASLVIVGIFYVVITRRGAGGTVGESLFRTTYASGRHIPMRPREVLKLGRALINRSDDELDGAADLLRALGEPNRLRLVQRLVEGPLNATQLAAATGMPAFEVHHLAARLEEVGVLTGTGEGDDTSFAVRPDLLGPLDGLLEANARATEAPGPASTAGTDAGFGGSGEAGPGRDVRDTGARRATARTPAEPPGEVHQAS